MGALSTRNSAPIASTASKVPKGCRSVEIAGQDGSLWQVLIGKSAEDNDRLSLEVGLPHETWMHAAGQADVLDKAANLAAFHSKAPKGSSGVVVQIAKCGQVSKLPRAPAGQVFLRG